MELQPQKPRPVVDARETCAAQAVCFRMSGTEQRMKRAFDVAFALSALLLLLPVFAIIATVLAIGGGKVLYKQERLGLHGKPFRIVKFRSMRPAAETSTPQLAQPDDDRLTRIGRFLRRHHLDELPQLWNVLVGDMAVIGPRPERPYFVAQIMAHDARYAYLFQVRPGLTSEATLSNGYTATMEKMLSRLALDLNYLREATLIYDLRIILRTARLVIKGD